jgi:hypothetical protein
MVSIEEGIQIILKLNIHPGSKLKSGLHSRLKLSMFAAEP